MNDDEALHTRREVLTPVAAELGAAGFEDAVEIGRGGFGVVYRCWQPALDRIVAVKVSTGVLDADSRARFLREQRAMGRLTGHPNTEPSGEMAYRSAALRGMGVAAWQQGDRDRAQRLLQTALRLISELNSPVSASFVLQSLAWVVADADPERAAVLMGATDTMWPAEGSATIVSPDASLFHRRCKETASRALGSRKFVTAFRRGQAMGMDAAVTFAIGKEVTTAPASRPADLLTNRERQVADLVAQGLSNKQIAAKLVISQRTAQGHVEHILTKLGFNSRVQIAAWVIDDSGRQST